MRPGAAHAMLLVAAALLARAGSDGAAPSVAIPRQSPHSGGARLLYGARLDPNREPAPILALLPGIGPTRASAIVATRPHCSLADIDRVPGIGPATLRTLSQFLAFPDLPGYCEHELRALGH